MASNSRGEIQGQRGISSSSVLPLTTTVASLVGLAATIQCPPLKNVLLWLLAFVVLAYVAAPAMSRDKYI
ncbi:hypothetical protein BV22DRAFT_1036334 [Leucogyrophana mollusca]|uniref:Uncharacterized protein n=1 Tax=Leucogyrophana mollusca TaxID=85980 RepID=A0ACB8BDI0_9AGAM|nr:hypothetical protein BV22DRAFT_1036334 [Leucogyrophana mollusca]